MKNILEKTIASILFNKLTDYFDDIESLTLIQTTQDFKLINEIQELINKLDQKDDIKSIEYDLVVSTWNKIYKSVNELNKNHSELIKNIKTTFKFDTKDNFLIAGTLFNHEKLFLKKLSKEWKNNYILYVKELNNIILKFRIDLLSYDTACIQDDFFEKNNIVNKTNIKFTKVNYNKKSVYLDTNAVQIYSNDKSLINLAKGHGFGFVYSSYTIEDIVNSNPIFIDSFISDLINISDGNMVGYTDDGLSFVTENIEDTKSRVDKYNKLTKLYEKTILTNVFTHYHLHPELRKGKDLNNKIKDNLLVFLKSFDKDKILGFEKVKLEFHDLFNDGLFENGILSKIKDYQKTITRLSDLFDFINYETESIKHSNKSKIMSAYRDRMHLEHAYICDYFVTDDRKLRERANAIFSIIRSETQVCNLNEFKKIIQTNKEYNKSEK